MRLTRLIFLPLLAFYPWKLTSADQYTDAALSILRQCYDASDEINADITLCFNEKINKIPNPLNYVVSIHASNSKKSAQGKITIFMINKTGFMLYCIGTAGEKLILKSCATDVGKPLTPEQILSIDAPL